VSASTVPLLVTAMVEDPSVPWPLFYAVEIHLCSHCRVISEATVKEAVVDARTKDTGQTTSWLWENLRVLVVLEGDVKILEDFRE